MPSPDRPLVGIVDYGMGNLFSVQRACERVGLEARLASSRRELERAEGVILPGVGAFGDAMQALRRLELVEPLRTAAASGKPFMGICLGLQLLMRESHEFGRHEGLGIVEGDVVRLSEGAQEGRRLKVPQVGWNRIAPAQGRRWADSWLRGLPDGACLYFVHSFYVRPADPSLALSQTRYGPTEFCSSLQRGNLFACQFHPERSGSLGLAIYRNFAAAVMSPALSEVTRS